MTTRKTPAKDQEPPPEPPPAEEPPAEEPPAEEEETTTLIAPSDVPPADEAFVDPNTYPDPENTPRSP